MGRARAATAYISLGGGGNGIMDVLMTDYYYLQQMEARVKEANSSSGRERSTSSQVSRHIAAEAGGALMISSFPLTTAPPL